MIISLCILLKDFLQFKKSNEENAKLIEEVIIKENSGEESVVDWQKLENINKEIIGWIKIEGTNIDYPILKDDYNLKYLNRSYDGKYNKNGSIFTLNNNPFQDDITILYGHNMKSGIMFSELSKYMNKEFLDKHKHFTIYTKEHTYQATIFSCYSIGITEEEQNVKLLNFEEEVDYYKNASVYSTEENIGEIKKIVKLSTCSYLNNRTTPTDQRYYVVAKLEKVG